MENKVLVDDDDDDEYVKSVHKKSTRLESTKIFNR